MYFDRRSMLITSWEMWLCKWINLLVTIQYLYFIVHIEQWQIETKWKYLFLYISYRWHPYISVSLHNFYRHRIQIKWLCKLWHFLALAPTAGIVFYMMLLYRTSDKRMNETYQWGKLLNDAHGKQPPPPRSFRRATQRHGGRGVRSLRRGDFDIEQR